MFLWEINRVVTQIFNFTGLSFFQISFKYIIKLPGYVNFEISFSSHIKVYLNQKQWMSDRMLTNLFYHMQAICILTFMKIHQNKLALHTDMSPCFLNILTRDNCMT